MKMRDFKKATFKVIKIIGIVVIILISVFPICWMLSLSIRSIGELTANGMGLLPHSFTLEHYVNLFREKNFGLALKNSLIVTSASLGISLIFGIMCAYVLARQRFRFAGKKILSYWILLVRVLPPIAFAVPLYIIFSKAGWLTSLVPMILVCIFINIPLIIWFLISFFQDLPIEMEESAKIDGATEWKLFVKIIVPLILPGIAAVSMLSFVSAWNEYTYSVIFVQSPSIYTIPLSLAILNTEENILQYGLVAAGSMISIIPMAIFVIFAQKYLIAGLASGAVKG